MRKRLAVVVVLGLALLSGSVLFTVSSAQHGDRNDRLEEEIRALQAEAERIRIENGGIAEKIAYLSSPEFREREAKEKLGLKRLGEQVVGLSAPVIGTGRVVKEETTLDEKGGSVEFVEPNYLRWWKRFATPVGYQE